MEASLGEFLFGAVVMGAFAYGLIKYAKARSASKKGGRGGGGGPDRPPTDLL